MKHKSPTVREYMTRLPVEVERCDTVGDAAKLMESHGIRHIPVLSGLDLVGVVSERDIREARIRFGKKCDKRGLEEICTRDVARVSPVDSVTAAAKTPPGCRHVVA